MVELEYYHFATPNEIIGLDNYNLWLLKLLSRKLMNNL